MLDSIHPIYNLPSDPTVLQLMLMEIQLWIDLGSPANQLSFAGVEPTEEEVTALAELIVDMFLQKQNHSDQFPTSDKDQGRSPKLGKPHLVSG